MTYECSRTPYSTRPIPKEGSMTLGVYLTSMTFLVILKECEA